MRDVVNIHGFLLTGGAVLPPHVATASLLTDGQPVAERVARELRHVCRRVTVLGPETVPGATDRITLDEPMAGPLAALGQIPWELMPVFVVSCDLPFFNHRLVPKLVAMLDDGHMAVIPEVNGKAQPLCAAYSPSAFALARRMVAAGEKRVMAWVEQLSPLYVELDRTKLASSLTTISEPDEWQKAC